MYKRLAVSSAFWLIGSCVAATGETQSSIQIFQRQGARFKNEMQMKYKPDSKVDKWFSSTNPPASSLCNYAIYVVLYPDDPRMRVVDATSTYLYDDSTEPRCDAIKLQLPGADADEKQFTIPLITPLHAGVRYMLALKNPSDSNPDTNALIASFTSASTLSLLPGTANPIQLKVTSTVALNVAVGTPINIVSHAAIGGAGADVPFPAKVVNIDPSGVFIALQKNLPSGTTGAFQLATKDLTDYYGKDIAASGKISIATSGAPLIPGSAAASSAFITAQLSSIAAVHSTPTFSATGALGPLNTASRMIEWPKGSGIFFDPVVNFDVGTTNAKSSNSVIVPSEFTRDFTLLSRKIPPAGLDPSAWKNRRPSSLNIGFGPRAEFDTLYGGVNLLGEARADLYLSPLYKTAASKKLALAAGNPAIRDLLQMPDGGFSISPYLQYDGGGHLNAQTIVNSGKSPAAQIPTYDISRLYMGVVATGTYKRSSLNFDGAWIDAFSTETVPMTVSKVVQTKALGGFQPHAKGTFSFALDAPKHYLLTLCWEDGRTAPSFVYLNKATAGIQIVY